MAETVDSLRFSMSFVGRVTGEDGAKVDVNIHETVNFADGTNANQITKVWQDLTRALNNTSEDLDFGTDGQDDFQGADVVLPGMKVLFIKNLSTTAGQTVTLKDGSVNSGAPMGGTSPTIPIGPGGILVLINPTDGYTITDNAADRLGIETNANISYKALVAG